MLFRMLGIGLAGAVLLGCETTGDDDCAQVCTDLYDDCIADCDDEECTLTCEDDRDVCIGACADAITDDVEG
jgi:hypothetical protein